MATARGPRLLLLLLFAAISLILGGGGLSLLFPRDARRATLLGAGGAVAGSALGLLFALFALASNTKVTYREPWILPSNTLFLEVDALSALFLIIIFLLGTVAAVFGAPYLRHHAGNRPLGAAWFHFGALIVSMAVVVVARNGILFLIAWESMALTSFFLVMFDGREPGVRRAGWIYFVATHLGTAFVLAFFAILGARAGSLDFDRLAASAPLPPSTATLCFLLAVAGFGAKAGFVPLHVWLPEAHPAAPSHVSAVMSGAMIKMGIYALIRGIAFLGPPEIWWGWLLVLVGASSGVLGVLFALAQHDLKRLLAYHSVENIGIIALGLGVGVLGLTAGAPLVAFAGFAGALLHALNHAVFKGLLFLGAGAVQGATHTRDMERLGGLMRRMPWTGATFLTGSAAISGLPPLNGFVSEFLIFSGAFAGAATLGPAYAVPLAAVVGALALIGGLAAACFAKVVGIVFLGEPRDEEARNVRDPPAPQLAALIALASLCFMLGLTAPLLVGAVAPVVVTASGMSPTDAAEAAASLAVPLGGVALLGGVVLALVLLLTGLRVGLLRGRPVERAPTWDCGYPASTSRMQYTASSFASPLTDFFRKSIRARPVLEAPEGPFPRAASFHTETPDPLLDGVFTPLFIGARRALSRALPLQNGRVQFYVLYVVAALVALLLWEMM